MQRAIRQVIVISEMVTQAITCTGTAIRNQQQKSNNPRQINQDYNKKTAYIHRQTDKHNTNNKRLTHA